MIRKSVAASRSCIKRNECARVLTQNFSLFSALLASSLRSSLAKAVERVPKLPMGLVEMTECRPRAHVATIK